MKNQPNMNKNRGGQGMPTSDRAFTDHKEDMQQKSVSNGGGQRSFQTSNKDNDWKVANKKH